LLIQARYHQIINAMLYLKKPFVSYTYQYNL